MNLAQQIEREYQAAFDRYVRHRKKCSLCTPVGSNGTSRVCALAQVLRKAYRDLDELQDEPSRWTAVELIEPPSLSWMLTYQTDRAAAIAVGVLIERLTEGSATEATT